MSTTRLAFIRSAPPLAGWRLVLLLAGLAALLPTGARWMQQWSATRQLEGELAAVQPRPSAPAALPASQQREQDQQTKVVAEAVRQLNLPVARLLKTLQAPGDMHIALLGLDLNGQPVAEAAGSLKIAAEAETAQDMLNYLSFLDEQPLFRSVYLVKHETAGAGPAYRFQLEAQWRQ